MIHIEEGEIAHNTWERLECETCLNNTIRSVIHSGKKQLTWDFLTHVFCISLKQREERRKKAMKEFHRVGLCEYVVFYVTEKDSKSGVRGCWESHRAIAKHMTEIEADWYVVFEDDVIFKSNFSQKSINKIKRCLNQLPKDWSTLYWGGLPKYVFYMDFSKDIAKWAGWNLHAVMISNRLAKKLADTPYDYVNYNSSSSSSGNSIVEVDHWITQVASQHYLIFPPIALTKDDGVSDLNSDRNIIVQYLHQWKNLHGSFIEEVLCWFYVLLPYIFILIAFIILVQIIVYFSKRWHYK
jgi:hypothetical protein